MEKQPPEPIAPVEVGPPSSFVDRVGNICGTLALGATTVTLAIHTHEMVTGDENANPVNLALMATAEVLLLTSSFFRMKNRRTQRAQTTEKPESE